MPQARYRYRSSFYSYFPRGIKWLLISNTAVFLVWTLGPVGFQQDVLSYFALNKVLSIRLVWQLFTYLFLHGGVFHLVFNMLALWMFGAPLETDWGTRRFLRYYFICGVGAGICDLLLNLAVGGRAPTIGASGAIYGVLVAFGVCYPEQTVLMNFLFPIKAKYMVMIYAAIALYGSMSVNSGVSNIAHLGGMAVGFIYLKSNLPRRQLKLPDWQGAYRQWKLERAKRKFQVYMKKHGRQDGPWVN
ncbi:MAG TPA: rhomboid family intramembrane serine protease [Candidatus Acidoferrales bacterium]|nr:rhomboid family intramembrane serine protease [Candidatus Acidoferrales bacterium]